MPMVAVWKGAGPVSLPLGIGEVQVLARGGWCHSLHSGPAGILFFHFIVLVFPHHLHEVYCPHCGVLRVNVDHSGVNVVQLSLSSLQQVRFNGGHAVGMLGEDDCGFPLDNPFSDAVPILVPSASAAMEAFHFVLVGVHNVEQYMGEGVGACGVDHDCMLLVYPCAFPGDVVVPEVGLSCVAFALCHPGGPFSVCGGAFGGFNGRPPLDFCKNGGQGIL